jgi:hypothetical protein
MIAALRFHATRGDIHVAQTCQLTGRTIRAIADSPWTTGETDRQGWLTLTPEGRKVAGL